MLKKVTYISSPIFPVYLGVCDNAEAWSREMKRLKVRSPLNFTDTCGSCTTLESDSGQLNIIVSLDAGKLKDEPLFVRYEVLAHEACHVVDFILEHIGEGCVGWETRAYMTQWVVREFGRILEWS